MIPESRRSVRRTRTARAIISGTRRLPASSRFQAEEGAACDGAINTDRSFLLRRLNRFGEEDLRALFLIHRADRIATGYTTREREDIRLRERMAALDALLAEKPCFTLKDLAVRGTDLIPLGLRGPQIGEALQALLEAVMDGKAENTKESLLNYLQSNR